MRVYPSQWYGLSQGRGFHIPLQLFDPRKARHPKGVLCRGDSSQTPPASVVLSSTLVPRPWFQACSYLLPWCAVDTHRRSRPAQATAPPPAETGSKLSRGKLFIEALLSPDSVSTRGLTGAILPTVRVAPTRV